MSSVRSTKSSNKTLRRVTRSQSATSNIETQLETTTNLDNEKNIISDTYGPSPITTPNDQNLSEIKQNIENTAVITMSIETSDRDIIMGNTREESISTHILSSSSSLLAITTPHQNLAHSIHATEKGKNSLHNSNTNQNSRNTFNMIFTSLQNDDHHTTSNNAPINNDFNDTNNLTFISDTENLTINDYTDFYLSFALLNEMPYNSLHKIKTEILRHFLNVPSFRGFMEIQNYYGVKILKIAFYDEAERNSIHNIYISKFNTCFYNYEPNYIEQIIIPILESKYDKTNKVVDIPKHIDNTIILETISKEIRSIVNFFEPKKYADRHNSQSRPPAQSKRSRPSFFKQLKIEFENSSSIHKIIEQEIWSITVGDFTIRILPNEIKSIAYIERSSYQYKLIGLPINSTLKSLEPLLKKIHTKTCTFVPTDKRCITKSAYVYIAQKDFISKNKPLNINNHNIYIMNPKLKHCTFNNKFKSLIQTPLNKSKPPQANKQTANNERTNKNITLKNTAQRQTQENNLLQQLLKENAELKSLLQQLIHKINALESIQKDVNKIKKNILDNKEKITQTNAKVDIIITRTEELNQNVLTTQHTNQNTNTYRRKKEKLIQPTNNNSSNKYNFNPQIDTFSDIGRLKTISSILDTNINNTTPIKNYTIPINPPKHLINETESEYMESINYEESSSPSDIIQNTYDNSNNLSEQSTSQWNFNPLRK
ncbi:hypothetical protein C1645_733835 [Glomus cerebriforme]|uniref:Uncharacterized protein n=1 Tax=Glomus cerebriforme TaxID=658196 RepID=A0A397TCT9_9GLOM|nr:hypothetical protein C1645_733835 [Glomus cerebriforme]